MSESDSSNDSLSIASEQNSLSSATDSNFVGKEAQTQLLDDKATQKDLRAIKISKFLVLIVLSVAAVACGTATYLFTSNEEEDNFESQYQELATTVIDASVQEAQNIFGFIENFGSSIKSFVVGANGTWPNVTIPDFERRASLIDELNKALQITLVPLVASDAVNEWEIYSIENQGWIGESLDFSTGGLVQPEPIAESIFVYSEIDSGDKVIQDGTGLDFGPGAFAPVWQQSPVPMHDGATNFDLFSHPAFAHIYQGVWQSQLPILSEVLPLDFLYKAAITEEVDHPLSFVMHPIYSSGADTPDKNSLVAFLVAVLPWETFFINILPAGVGNIDIVLQGSCGDDYTYRLSGPNVAFLENSDLHDPSYEHLQRRTSLTAFLDYNFSETYKHCSYDVVIYPTAELEDSYTASNPALYTSIVVLVFAFLACVFLLYDHLIEKHQAKVMSTANRTNAIVSSLFPSAVRDRILKDVEDHVQHDINGKKNLPLTPIGKTQWKTFLGDENGDSNYSYDSKPIAELFAETTVMFADIVGFTAWSSVREPSQVFTLLETVYHAFDEIAKRRRVFKVETVGDCYVAVTGLPDPRKDHAIVMARFARDCLHCMNGLTKQLEVTLGPDTGDLSMRFGLHSGPVTAGVLRGDKSRFQLFGDTVNTASRIEGTGERNKIHLSQETAKHLIEAGKEHWLKVREDKVHVKGKGELITYWLDLRLQGYSAHSVSTDEDNSNAAIENVEDTKFVDTGLKVIKDEEVKPGLDDKSQRLIDWNTDVLARLLRQIVARRNISETHRIMETNTMEHALQLNTMHGKDQTVIDEVKEIIHLPEFDATFAGRQADPDKVELGETVIAQLRDLIGIIATMYRDNPFHNFEHASHVTMSVVKLLSRIVAPDDLMKEGDQNQTAAMLHDHTYGITSDPLTQFACVFAALIHDVDHTGVPNTQLVKEGLHVSKIYKGKSVAEQNSVDVAWELLQDPSFNELRRCIHSNDAELKRFRQLVVNSVMATDIMDKDLKALRNARWEKAFSDEHKDENPHDMVNRKATIVIEHLIQASDVAHTMQHWHIYRKWNERLFHEMYKAYKLDRADKDPSEFWYKGEIGFFDFYIIPLAKKLKDCGVFGVSSDEYLNYAEKNRQEWELNGQQVVEQMIERYHEMYADLDIPERKPNVELAEVEQDEKFVHTVASRMRRADSGDGVEPISVKDLAEEKKDDKNQGDPKSHSSEPDDVEDRVRERLSRSNPRGVKEHRFV